MSAIAIYLTGRTVPAEIGLTFGFHLAIKGFPIPLVNWVERPPMGQRRATRQTRPLPYQSEHMVGDTFEVDWELLPGTWTFSVQMQITLLFCADYDVAEPATLGTVQRTCFGHPDRS